LLQKRFEDQYGAKYRDRIAKAIAEAMAKYKARMDAYFKSLQACPSCKVSYDPKTKTVTYCNGNGECQTMPAAILTDYERIFGPIKK